MTPRSTSLLLACPRIAPDYELAAVHALMKPQMADRIRYRSGEQPWPAGGRGVVTRALGDIAGALAYQPRVDWPASGEYHFLARIPRAELEEAKASALLLSRRLPDVWLVLGRLFLRNGRFYRRQYGYKLNLIPAGNVHLRRDIRSAIRTLLSEG